MSKYFSKSNIGFYDEDIKYIYMKAGSWPDDAVSVEDSVWEKFSGAAPTGKYLSAGADGLPCWGDILDVTPVESLYSSKVSQLKQNMDEAITRITTLDPFPNNSLALACLYGEAITKNTVGDGYVPTTLKAMVENSNSLWDMSSLVETLVDNSSSVRYAIGMIFGEVKIKSEALSAILSGITSGTHTKDDLSNFDCSITVPTVNVKSLF